MSWRTPEKVFVVSVWFRARDTTIHARHCKQWGVLCDRGLFPQQVLVKPFHHRRFHVPIHAKPVVRVPLFDDQIALDFIFNELFDY